jgi:hypothetical protein
MCAMCPLLFVWLYVLWFVWAFVLFCVISVFVDRLCGLVVRVLDYRSWGPGSISDTTRFSEKEKKGKQVVGLERGPLSLVSTTEKLLDK